MITLQDELRYDALPPHILNPAPSLEAQERSTLRLIRERRREHTDIMRQWRRQIAERNGPAADASLSYAKDIRDLVHTHARNVRLIRQRLAQTAARAAARQAAE